MTNLIILTILGCVVRFVVDPDFKNVWIQTGFGNPDPGMKDNN
jgi:hypothetical protein